MNLLEAKQLLKEMANGEYHYVNYEITEFASGELEQECTVYIHGRNIYSDISWELALGKMERAIKAPEVIIDPVEPIKIAGD